MASDPTPDSSTLLQRLGLHRPELRAWAMYDWANSAMVTIIITAVYPIYFSKVAAGNLKPDVATDRHALATMIALLIVAFVSPVLGAIADYAAIKKRLLACFLFVGVLATSGMFFVHSGDWPLAMALFIVANIGAAGSFVFYDSLLPHVARDGEMDRVSTTAYALGYLGGGLLLAVNLAWIKFPHWFGLPAGDNLTEAQQTLPVRLAFLSVAVWWLVFSLPLLFRVSEPPQRLEADETVGENPVKAALVRLKETFQELRGYKHAFLFLLAFLIYGDGIGTIYKMSAVYGAELKIPDGSLLAALLAVQFIGIPFAIGFGMLAGRLGAKNSILIGLAVYVGVSILGYFMKTAVHFWALAILVAMVQGGTQALSRSLFASMIPREKSAEFFAFFAVCEKFAGIFGPAIFAAISSRTAVLAVLSFFIVGGVMLLCVDVAQGQQIARAVDAKTRPTAEPAPPSA